MFVIVKCPGCKEDRVSDVRFRGKETIITNNETLFINELETIEIKESISLETFIKKIKPYVILYTQKNGITKLSEYLIKDLRVAPSAVPIIIQKFNEGIITEPELISHTHK